MTQVVLNDEQARALQEASEIVELLDAKGNTVGYVMGGVSSKDIATARRRADSDGPWHTTKQVLEHLRSLEQS